MVLLQINLQKVVGCILQLKEIGLFADFHLCIWLTLEHD